MLKFIAQIVISGLSVMLTAYLLPEATVENFAIAILVGATISLLNMVLKPILVILTLPITIVTLGLFYLLLNGFMIYIADYLIDGFVAGGLFSTLVFSLVLSVISSVFGFINRRFEKKQKSK
jgi:putative membrane protein